MIANMRKKENDYLEVKMRINFTGRECRVPTIQHTGFLTVKLC